MNYREERERSLRAVLERKREIAVSRDIADVAHQTRRPGQCVADRVRELRRELAA